MSSLSFSFKPRKSEEDQVFFGEQGAAMKMSSIWSFSPVTRFYVKLPCLGDLQFLPGCPDRSDPLGDLVKVIDCNVRRHMFMNAVFDKDFPLGVDMVGLIVKHFTDDFVAENHGIVSDELRDVKFQVCTRNAW